MAPSPDNMMDFNDSSVDLSTIRAVAVSIASAEQREREVIRREDLDRAFSDGKVYWHKEDLTRKTEPLASPPLPFYGTVLQSSVVDKPCEDGRDYNSDRTRTTPHEYASTTSRRSSLSSERKRMSKELLLSSETLHFSEQDRRSAALLFDLIMEIEEIENKRRSRVITNEALQVLITNVCCKLDGTDTNGSEGLRCMRKSIINMAEAVAQRSEEMEDKYNNKKKSTTNNKPSEVESSQPRKKLTLPGYSLGDNPSNNQHMVTPSSHKDGIEYASTLQPLDFAFILRSNGTWTYAVVCDILNCNITNNNNNKSSIKFVVDRQGCTRTIPKKYWGKYICLINEDHAKQVMNSDETSAAASGAMDPGTSE
jgi:hypothetical protein